MPPLGATHQNTYNTEVTILEVVTNASLLISRNSAIEIGLPLVLPNFMPIPSVVGIPIKKEAIAAFQ